MTRTVELTTTLDTDADTPWQHVQTSALLDYIARPLIRFVPKGMPFPEIWTPGEYRAWMLLFGALPIGWQAIVISYPEAPRESVHVLRDNGYSPIIKRWDHWIEIEDVDGKTRYTDRVHIDAGLLTGPVAAFARAFYAHRQRRWRKLVRHGFRPLKT